MSSNPAEKLLEFFAQCYVPGQKLAHQVGQIYVLLIGTVRCAPWDYPHSRMPRSADDKEPKSALIEQPLESILIQACTDQSQLVLIETDPGLDYVVVEPSRIAVITGRIQDLPGMAVERVERYQAARAVVVTRDKITLPPPNAQAPITRPEPKLKRPPTPATAFRPALHSTVGAMPAAKREERESPSPLHLLPPGHDEPPVTQPSGPRYPSDIAPVSVAAREQHADSRRATLAFPAAQPPVTSVTSAAATASVPPTVSEASGLRSPVPGGSKLPFSSSHRGGRFDAPSDPPAAPNGNEAE